jgi:hypothetical protein
VAPAQDHVKVRAIIEAGRVIRCNKFADHCSTAHNSRSDETIYSGAPPKIIARRNPLIRQKRQQVAGNLLHSNYTWEPERATGNRCFDRHPAGSSSSFDIFTQS